MGPSCEEHNYTILKNIPPFQRSKRRVEIFLELVGISVRKEQIKMFLTGDVLRNSILTHFKSFFCK